MLHKQSEIDFSAFDFSVLRFRQKKLDRPSIRLESHVAQYFFRWPSDHKSLDFFWLCKKLGHRSDSTNKKRIQHIDLGSPVLVSVRKRAKVSRLGHRQRSLLLHLSHECFFESFVDIHESTGQPIFSLAGISAAYQEKKFAVIIAQDRAHGCRWAEIKTEITIAAMKWTGTDHGRLDAASWTKSKGLQNVIWHCDRIRVKSSWGRFQSGLRTGIHSPLNWFVASRLLEGI